MDLVALRLHLRELSVPVDDPPSGPAVAAWTASVEARLGDDSSPTGRALLAALDDLAAAFEEPWPLDAVRPERVVRWDADSSTWIGTEVSSGGPVLVRVLRAAALRRPVRARAFRREATALARVLPAVVEEGSVRAPLTGWGVARLAGPDVGRALGTALGDLERWRAAGLSPAAPTPDELRTDATGRVRVVCLTLAADPLDAVRAVFARIDPADDGPLPDALRAPPASPDDARARLVRAMAADLAARRHALVHRWREGRHAQRQALLLDLVERLQRAVPPPTGQGAVGVDLDGRITVVRGEPARVSFGPANGLETVWDPLAGFRPPLVRRMLRSRAMSPPNPVLDQRVGGDPAHTEALCRWVAAGSKLRTVHLLLAASR